MIVYLLPQATVATGGCKHTSGGKYTKLNSEVSAAIHLGHERRVTARELDQRNDGRGGTEARPDLKTDGLLAQRLEVVCL